MMTYYYKTISEGEKPPIFCERCGRRLKDAFHSDIKGIFLFKNCPVLMGWRLAFCDPTGHSSFLVKRSESFKNYDKYTGEELNV